MKIVVILGPTGTGKTELSIALAKKMNAEIINADATQVYKEVNIGVAKITEEQKQGIPHHLMDIVSVKDNYTVMNYQKDGRAILDQKIKENKNIIIVGGTGLYIKALLYNYKFMPEEEKKTYEGITNEELKKRADEIYPQNEIHKNNRKRLERFLSHYDVTGEIIKTTKEKDEALYEFTLIGLTAPREELYNHLNKRVEIMMCEGLCEEVKDLYHKKLTKAENFIGYKEFTQYFKGEKNIMDCMEETKKNSRKYAKRQYTWFKNQFQNVKWFQVDYNHFNKTIKKVSDYLDTL
ncbi:MAG: tRNA (adenosine(37)-N6)-dimethylallyltransferase MiaA [Bacilli bacterium]|nr:tRNA (adenosine(37)-N6)-dimethylallyltransferase MiaA [Bacilli bacterium]